MTHLMMNTLKYALFATGLLFALMAAEMAKAVTVPVLKETVRAGTVITEDMVGFKPYDDRRIPRGSVTHPEQLIGKEAIRTVREGRPVYGRHLRVPPFAARGERVVIEYRKAGMRLTSEGELLADASLGESVRVQNLDTRHVIIGTIIAEGLVEVN